MNIKRVAFIVGGVFFAIVALAVCVSARFSLSNITSDPYAFISSFFNQWSLALSAAGTIILAVSVFLFIYENRRREEIEMQQVIHALHNEIHWNLPPTITLRFKISERFKHVEESNIISTDTEGLYNQIETRVFDDIKSRGQLHWLEELRGDVTFSYYLIDIYNSDRRFKLGHLELLTKLHDCLDKTIRALEAKFKFLPRYVRYEDTESTAEEVTNETSYPSRQGENNNVLKSNLNNQEPSSFKPLPWGVLFFSFWTSLRTIENPALMIQGTAWFFLGLSVILLLAVFTKPLFPFLQKTITKHSPRLSKILTSQNVNGFFVLLVFYTTLIGFPVNIIMSLTNLEVIDVSIAVVGLLLWVIAYILILASIVSRMGRPGQIIGGVIIALILWSAKNAFTSNALAGWILIGLGVILIIVVIVKPKTWDFWQMV